ncbi:hypothetical protein [Kitasatospora sp. NPDC085879]|uniref:hypothetical protein n=1 Tax=Kitasatospora sp. NPDC085879 TaxID=3154769 RepID=UPI000BB1036A|nr:hypothetical protein [Streptomyces sp. TLI_235]PBC70423.1 hypothetical protein BX265_7843 [Streptomyces sp. TLI_235]
MNSWINLDALWKIVLVGLLAGAGLPALFAVGVRALNPPPRGGGQPAGRRTAGPLNYTVAVACFAVVLAAIGWGVSVIVNQS